MVGLFEYGGQILTDEQYWIDSAKKREAVLEQKIDGTGDSVFVNFPETLSDINETGRTIEIEQQGKN